MKSKFLKIRSLTSAVMVSIACPFAQAADPAESASVSTNKNPSTQTALPVADFEKGKLVTLADTPWHTFTDSSLSGKSSVSASVTSTGASGSKGAMLLTGKLTPEFQWGGFAGITALLQKGTGSTTNLSRFTGIQFAARGDGKTYRVLVGKDNVTDDNHFFSEFVSKSEWSLVKVPFTSLAQSPYFGTKVSWSAENITAVGFMAVAQLGETSEIKLEIDNVAFY